MQHLELAYINTILREMGIIGILGTLENRDIYEIWEKRKHSPPPRVGITGRDETIHYKAHSPD